MTTGDGASTLVVPARLVPCLAGLPALDLAAPGAYVPQEATEHWLAHLYRKAILRRVIAAEHTSLLERADREVLEVRFKAEPGTPGDANLLSATPTLEMGVDIGGLSAVLLCSVSPAQAHYLQRVGRAGRRDGNALTLTVAAERPHDLYFYARPEDMMSVEEYRSRMIQARKKEVEDAYRDAAHLIAEDRTGLPYAAVIVDEAQDMGPQAFRLLRALAPAGPNDLSRSACLNVAASVSFDKAIARLRAIGVLYWRAKGAGGTLNSKLVQSLSNWTNLEKSQC